jgi:hypothetical protein
MGLKIYKIIQNQTSKNGLNFLARQALPNLPARWDQALGLI